MKLYACWNLRCSDVGKQVQGSKTIFLGHGKRLCRICGRRVNAVRVSSLDTQVFFGIVLFSMTMGMLFDLENLLTYGLMGIFVGWMITD